MTARISRPTPSPALQGAIEWWVHLNSGTASTQDYEAFRQWRAADPAHDDAWQSTQALSGKLATAAGPGALAALDRTPSSRRRVLAALMFTAGVGLTGSAAYRTLPWREWSAAHRTDAGEQQLLTLDDGTTILLNTRSAVDVEFDAAVRRVVLRTGEMLVHTAADGAPRPRPFVVNTAFGLITARGTRFSVRQYEDDVRVEVEQGAVDLQPYDHSAPLHLVAGEAGRLAATNASAVMPWGPAGWAWSHGMIVADNMRLADFAAELARYRPGRLTAASSVADLRISGAFPVADTDRALHSIARTLPIRIDSLTRYWVTLTAA
ncbi:FecR domain-containing protein [Alcaligenaceae bacterium B3P038]|nr:FecR domain-containing protein [Alcaligenaceae bacterium B3P038]